MLEANAISFRYRHHLPWVLRDFSMCLHPGEVVGLSGVSGLGKTTLAKIMAGYLTPQHGNITWEGKPISDIGFSAVQLVWQHPELALNPRWLVCKSLHEAGPVSNEMMHRFSIEHSWLNRYPHELSGGELQRIAVARALQPATRILICDEITSMLDAITQAQLWHALRQSVLERQLGLLVISHNAPLLRQLCTRTIDIAKSSRS